MMFFHHENPNEASNGVVKAVTLQRFSKFSNIKFSPLCAAKEKKIGEIYRDIFVVVVFV